MKVTLIIVAVVVAFLGIGIVVGNNGSNESNSESVLASQNNFSQIESEINNGSASLIDVRTVQEYNAGYIKGAENFTLQSIEAGSLPDLPKEEKIYVYCRSGNRSAEAKSLLEGAGFTNVIDLGGYQDVVDLGGTLVN